MFRSRYTTAAIGHLHATRPDVVADDTALARVAPVAHAYVNSFGRYDLYRQPPPPGQLRPLCLTRDDTDRALPTPPLGVSSDKR